MRALGGVEVPADGPDDDEHDMQCMSHKKVKLAVEHLQDETAKVGVMSALLVTEPGDHLSQKLQHLDNDSEEWSLMDLVRENGPIQAAQAHMYKLLGTDKDLLNLGVLAWHFQGRHLCANAVDDARSAIVDISAMVWAKSSACIWHTLGS